MSRAIVAPLACVLLASMTVLARSAPLAQATITPKTGGVADVNVVGCLAKGSGANAFVLEKAKAPTERPSDPGVTYRLGAMAGRSIDWSVHLGHKVQVMGVVTPASGPSQPPVLTASIVLPVSNLCTQTP
jgi:hypothetical protein